MENTKKGEIIGPPYLVIRRAAVDQWKPRKNSGKGNIRSSTVSLNSGRFLRFAYKFDTFEKSVEVVKEKHRRHEDRHLSMSSSK